MTRNGFNAFALEALGLSKKSFTSANVACLNEGPPNSGGKPPTGEDGLLIVVSVDPCRTGLSLKLSGVWVSAERILECRA